MKYLVLPLVFAAGYLAANLTEPSATAQQQQAAQPAKAKAPANPAIDIAGHLQNAQDAAKVRENRRVTEEEFIKMSEEEGTIILDARSKAMYDLLHVAGAINLSFPDIDLVSLPKVLPDKNARILIYCNNNFTDPNAFDKPAPGVNTIAREAMRPKMPVASLNLSTYATLHGYGYKNIYELAPLLDPAKSKIKFESNVKPK